MLAQVILTPAEGKRLIGKAIAHLPIVKGAKENGTIIVATSTTNAYVLEEILGKEINDKGMFTAGVVTKEGLEITEGKGRYDHHIIEKGKVRTVKVPDLPDVLKVMGPGDVFIKGANAIDPFGAAVLFEEKYGKDPAGEIYLLRKQIGSHLKDFLKNYQIPKIREFPTEIIALEHRLEVIMESFRLTAKLDRVEKRGGRTTILDYKTSASKQYLSIHFKKLDPGNRETWSEAIGTLQLPVYLTVYSQAAGEKPEDIDCLFLLLGRNIIDPAIELPLFKDKSEFKENFENLTEIIFRLLKEIVDPGLPFLPTLDPKNRCAGCLYGHICTNPVRDT